ncbi:AarF/ABC1/UbiB kinase family protein [Actinomadura viridis]|uniref:Unusual protein kinase regulating ubiquinone biosynthesis (AarF/ABC1/UbiB family) n=1 Tax=Actinomadura viridis TaxID=58110 RepID=A0A931DE00_9ACTN|nr:AarF/ABC1/UbiB kinase family protein [Actinomadura viridis]MBG6087427.1 putative unusual protein kinase regulating ubiquinone biosynthesis (AarF/ABC1/UbiB family) [Actinomadura viridis]
MSDLPRRAVTRSAKLASLPLGFAGRTALGVGKRTFGRPAEAVAMEIQQRTAEQLFKVLGELKGGAMKLGQMLSIFEAALPPEIAGPYRATLTKLQEAAPPLPAAAVHKVLAQGLGEDWRDRFESFDDAPAAAASIGQVHQGVWEDGRRVAVKVQYPGAGKALISDFNQLARLAKLFSVLMPGLDVKSMLAELKERVAEELDYTIEAASQTAVREAYPADDPDFYIPEVIAQSGDVLVTEWIDGTPLSKIISEGEQEERDHAALLYCRFLLSGPKRSGMLHGDPHPGNFRVMADGRLGVMDFGAVDRIPEDFQYRMGRLLRIGTMADIDQVEDALRREDFIREGVEIDAESLQAFLAPITEPFTTDTFKFSREWLRDMAARVTDLRPTNVVRQLNLPPEYVIVHRVLSAGTGVLCQLECEIPARAESLRWIPGFADDDLPAITVNEEDEGNEGDEAGGELAG